MAVDDIIEEICQEAEQFDIQLVTELRKGAVYLQRKEMHINPNYWSERAETFVHEMLHYYYDEIRGYDLGAAEEWIVETRMLTLMKNPDNKERVLKYIKDRNLY